MMKNKAGLSKFLIAIISTALLVGFLAFVSVFFLSSNSKGNQDLAAQKEVMAIVLDWGRLAPFPANATNVLIETEGGAFTRSFRASFVAPKQDIQSWIENSPGITEATPEKLPDNKVRYRILPGGGANKAEVTIDSILNKAEIYVSWS